MFDGIQNRIVMPFARQREREKASKKMLKIINVISELLALCAIINLATFNVPVTTYVDSRTRYVPHLGFLED